MSHLIGTVHLKLDPAALGVEDMRQGFSAVALVGRHLFAACDETASLERLTYLGNGRFGDHRTYPLADLVDLPNPGQEVDLEGLAWASPYLWLVGSHSRRRGKPEGGSMDDRMAELESVDTQENRYLLARIPVTEDGDGGGLVPCRACPDPRDPGTELRAQRLRGDGRDSMLMEALANDPHLRRFLKLPSKDNGFDVEGLALAGDGRLFVGLRGPVLGGWATVLELEPRDDDGGGEMLRLRRLGPGKQRYRKHFLPLDGLGIRDLCGDGEDLLVLAGPTMDVAAPAAIYRWRGALLWDGESVVDRSEVEKLIDLPHDVNGGCDHPEGICMLPLEGVPNAVLVVYDSTSSHRVEREGIRSDVYALPDRGKDAVTRYAQ